MREGSTDTRHRPVGAGNAVLPAARQEISILPTLAALLVLGLIVGAAAIRFSNDLVLSDAPQSGRWGFSDYRDAIYYPSRAWLAGENPYDTTRFPREYPVGRGYFPPYPPLALLLHAPLALLPFRVSVIAYFGLTIILTLLLARTILRFSGFPARRALLLGVAALICLTRPWQQNAYLGQTAVTMTLMSCIVLASARKQPWWAAGGLVVLAIKPTFLVGLVVLLAVRRIWRPIAYAAALAVPLALAAMVPLVRAAGGIDPLVETMRGDYRLFRQASDVTVATTRIRTDGLVFVSRLTGIEGAGVELLLLIATLVAGCWAVARFASRARGLERRALTATAAGAMLLAGSYHVGYDLLLLCLPALPLASTLRAACQEDPARRPRLGRLWHATLLGLVLVLLFNYASTVAGFRLLGVTSGTPWLLLTTINSSLILALLGACVFAAATFPRDAAARTR